MKAKQSIEIVFLLLALALLPVLITFLHSGQGNPPIRIVFNGKDYQLQERFFAFYTSDGDYRNRLDAFAAFAQKDQRYHANQATQYILITNAY